NVLPVSGDLLLLFLASVLGSAHCVGMCGPYVALCSARLSPGPVTAPQRVSLRLLFNAGRLATYAAIGALVGAFGQIALAPAAIAGSAPAGAATMLVFGLGTVPAIFLLSSLPNGLVQRLRAWRWAGLFIAAVGILLILRGLSSLGVLGHSVFW